MHGVEELDRSVLWLKAREDKKGNILDPKVADKARKIVSIFIGCTNYEPCSIRQLDFLVKLLTI